MLGCATPYQPMDFAGGYASSRVAPDRFLVEVRVNSFTSSSTAYAYFIRRANQLCRRAGYADWHLEDRTGGTDYLDVNGQAMAKPHIEGLVRCTAPRVARPPPAPRIPERDIEKEMLRERVERLEAERAAERAASTPADR